MEYFVEEYFDQNPISQVMHLTLCICLWVFTECAASVNCTVSSQIGIIATKNKRAEKLTDLAGWYISIMIGYFEKFSYFLLSSSLHIILHLLGNPKKHIAALKKAVDFTCVGEPSLYNSLNMAMQTLK